MKPRIKFIEDIKKDVENAKWFVGKAPEHVKWFLPQDFQYILNKKFSIKEKNKIISEYTEHVHQLNKEEIQKSLKITKKNWLKVEKRYYKLIDRLFEGHSWPKGNYRGFLSIYLMFPRNINNKTFFFSLSQEKGRPNKIIGHEMLHFIFFDYIKKRYGLDNGDRIKGKENRYLWKVSEVFNNVIEEWGPYKKIFHTNPRPYPGCEKIYKKMSKQWKKKQDVKWLLDQWLKVTK